MNTEKYTKYILEELIEILKIDSPTGYTQNAAEYVMQKYRALGYTPKRTVKGGILVDLDCQEEKKDNGILVEAHMDTLGGMVAEVKENGNLRLTPLGGMNPNNGEAENVKVITRNGKTYEGTFQLEDASIHVNGEYDEIKRTFDTMEVVLDEKITCTKDTRELGIRTGDIVCFDPRTQITETGFIKSRFLDDKLSVAILLGYAKYIKDEKVTTKRPVYHHITVYEEVGHGGAASVPKGVTEVLSVDMGCVGDGLKCREWQVSICAKDGKGPYSYDVVSDLIAVAEKQELDYEVDIYPHYSSDADVTLAAGYDVRHGLIGAGVYASHGYERSHVDGVKNTFLLLIGYIQ